MKRVERGFTIVELAIVLVVIGIILSMAVKGKSLVDTARLRAEINKVRKLEAAIHIYLVTHPDMQIVDRIGIGGPNNWGDFDMSYFYDNGILTASDLRSMVGRSDGRIGHWTPVQCMYYGDAISIYRGTYNQTVPFKPTNFCARIIGGVDLGEPGYSTMRLLPMPDRIGCALEVYLDDENVATGLARYLLGYNATDFTRAEYEDCMSLSMQSSTSGRDMGFVLY